MTAYTCKPSEFAQRLFALENDKLYDFTFQEHLEKRSLNANAYLWVLINEMANVLRTSKEELYLKMLNDYGQSALVTLAKEVDPSKYFVYYKQIKDNGKFIAYRVTLGSSKYNTKEMSILLDGVVQDCQMLGIETMTPSQLEVLKNEWQK